MPAKPSTPAVDPRAAFVAANIVRGVGEPPKGVIDDLRFFRKELDKTGQKMKFEAMQAWMKERHGYVAQRKRYSTVAIANSIIPWWK